MVHFKDRYKKYAYCSKCDIEVPSIRTVFEEYGWQVAVRQPWEYPRVYDDKGNMYYLQTLIPIRQINRRGLNGKIFEEIREFRVKVFCPECGKQCRSGSYSKTGAKNHYEPSWRGPKRGRLKDPDTIKEEVDKWVERIKQNEEILEELPPSLRSKVKTKIEKEKQAKESKIDN
jgi:hypothetical protein